MESAFAIDVSKFLSAGYVLLVLWINCTMYLISSFYQKRFNRPAPQVGFIIAILFGLLYVASLFCTTSTPFSQWTFLKASQEFFLIACSLASGWSSMHLFLIMKIKRK